MALFHSKIGRKIMRQRQNKNYRSRSSFPDIKLKIPKKQQKQSKNKKIPLWLNLKPKQIGKG